MSFKSKLRVSLLAMILIGSLMTCGNAFPQSVEEYVNIDIGISDLKEWGKESQEYPLLKQLIEEQNNTIVELRNSVSLKTKELELEKRENEINQRILILKDKEIEVLNIANQRLQEITDRAIKLAEVSKPKTNWVYTALGIVAAFAIGLAIGL
jgi:hypothetical protein